MGWWKADPVPASPPPPSSSSPPHPLPHPPNSTTDAASACPVDEKTRSAWLRTAQSNAAASATASPPSLECSSDRISQAPVAPFIHPAPRRPLSTDREVSSIPRSFSDEQQQLAPQAHTQTQTYLSPNPPKSKPSAPANAEQETGRHSSGNWIYPSESQFYNAVLAKNTASSPDALLASISHIVPIHNAVNERAWSLIKAWEAPYNSSSSSSSSSSTTSNSNSNSNNSSSNTSSSNTSSSNTSSSNTRANDASCTGPKLHSFHGRGAGALTPRAKWNSWVLGYKTPFDRHDWVVERCDGQKVEYVIDFYEGKSDTSATATTSSSSTRHAQGGNPANLNFYLDVRPKLNTWEGWRMRIEKGLGVK